MVETNSPDSRSYLATVIVPVYNKEDTVAACVESLLCQTIPAEKLEILLVDDGSRDASLSICRQLAAANDNVFVVAQENQGVSGARNTGIQNARGRYLFFLDADDSLSAETVENVTSFFDKVEGEVDLVTYPILYLNAKTGKTHGHKRMRWLKETGVYDLGEYPWIAQTTMNVCVKNMDADQILFERSLKMGEDQLFITTYLKNRAAIGFCEDAEYVYVKDGTNSSSKGNNPLYAFDDMIYLYSSLLEIGAEQPRMQRYAYQTVLYNIDWRLKSNLLFPIYAVGEKRAFEEERLGAVLEQIPAEEYVDSPYLDEYHKAFLLKRYERVGIPTPMVFEKSGTYVHVGEGVEWKTLVPKMLVTESYFEEGYWFFTGRIICPAFLLAESVEFYAVSRDSIWKINTTGSSYDYSRSKVPTARCFTFYLGIPEEQIVADGVIRIFGKVDDSWMPCVRTQFALRRHNGQLLYKMLRVGDWAAKCAGSEIVIAKLTKRERMQRALWFAKHPRDVAKRIAVKSKRRELRDEKVWMYADLPTAEQGGNALALLLHDLGKEDGVRRYYVTNHASAIVRKHPELKGRCIHAGTAEHLFVSLNSQYIFASYLEGFTFRPMRQRTFNLLADLSRGDQTLVYLQHGILHAHMPWYISHDRRVFDYIVVSTRLEERSLVEKYQYPLASLVPSGAPRLDSLDPDAPKENKILLVPSWRGYLVGGKASERIGFDEEFVKSSFYRGVVELIGGIEKSGVLERYNCSLDVKLHPNFECYEHLFDFDSENISLIHGTIDEGSYRVAISDFSSYIYDFVYCGCDVIYFVPDIVEFRAGLNHYSELDLPFEEGFGPFCVDPDDVCAKLEVLLGSSAESVEMRRLYRERAQEFFLHRDSRNCARLYDAVCEGEVDSLKLRRELSGVVLPEDSDVDDGDAERSDGE